MTHSPAFHRPPQGLNDEDPEYVKQASQQQHPSDHRNLCALQRFRDADADRAFHEWRSGLYATRQQLLYGDTK